MTHKEKCRAYYIANRKRLLSQAAEYRELHREEIREWHRAYYKTNDGKARILADRKKNRQRNTLYMRTWNKRRSPEQLEHARMLKRQWIENNRERHRLNSQVWKRNNIEKARKSIRQSIEKRKRIDPDGMRASWILLAHRKRLLTRQHSDGTLTPSIIRQLFAEIMECPYCGTVLTKSNRHLDHKEPLSRGGLHSLTNVTPCCQSCNHRKSNKPYAVWLQEIACPA